MYYSGFSNFSPNLAWNSRGKSSLFLPRFCLVCGWALPIRFIILDLRPNFHLPIFRIVPFGPVRAPECAEVRYLVVNRPIAADQHQWIWASTTREVGQLIRPKMTFVSPCWFVIALTRVYSNKHSSLLLNLTVVDSHYVRILRWDHALHVVLGWKDLVSFPCWNPFCSMSKISFKIWVQISLYSGTPRWAQ